MGLFSKTALPLTARDSSQPQCGKCGLYKDCLSPKMQTANTEGKLLIVGENPDGKADQFGLPIVGEARTLLLRALAAANIREDRCVFTNASICHAYKDAPKAYECCRPNLFNLLKELKPNAVLLMGSDALRSVFEKLWRPKCGGLTEWAGNAVPCRNPWNFWAVPTFAPQFVLDQQNPVVTGQFQRHVALAVRKAKAGKPWPADSPPDLRMDVQCYHDPDDGELITLMEYFLGKETPVAFDFETNCLKPETKGAKVYSVSFSDGAYTVAFPWVDGSRSAELAMNVMEANWVPKVASKLQMEDRWAAKALGVRVKNWHWDTMLAAHALDSRTGVTGLKFQAFALLGHPQYDDAVEPYLKSDGGSGLNKIHECDVNALLVYNALDSLLEWKVARLQKKRMGVADVA